MFFPCLNSSVQMSNSANRTKNSSATHDQTIRGLDSFSAGDTSYKTGSGGAGPLTADPNLSETSVPHRHPIYLYFEFFF